MLKQKKKVGNKTVPYLFILPALLLFGVLLIFPVIYGLIVSFLKWNLISPNKEFVGLENYVQIAKDSLLMTSFKNTVYYMVLTVPTTIVLSLGLACMLNSQLIKLCSFFRVVYFIPVVTSMVAISFIWRWLYQPSYGLINYFLSLIGIPRQGWLSSPEQAMLALAITMIWRTIGFDMVIFIAGLQAIPRNYYEAAEIDGAGPLQKFMKITIPLINPTFVFILVTSVIFSFQVFTPVFIMTSGVAGGGGGQAGGPLNATRVIVYHLYSAAFRELKMGYGSAIAFVLFGVILAVTLLQLKVLQRVVEY